MSKFHNLVLKLVSKGDEHLLKFGEKSFHLEAASLLSESNLWREFSLEELFQDFISNKVASQNFKHLEFSDLPLTIARGEQCFVDIYFWRRRPTTIHNHHFRGAFMCLYGNNVDLEFSFEPKFAIGEYHTMGDLKLLSERNIVPGDIAPINYLDKFIHQNHHQADLSINLCFRTSEKLDANLANFYYSGLRYEQNTQLITRVHQMRKFLEIMEHERADYQMSDDEMMRFLLLNLGTSSLNPRLHKFLEKCEKTVFDKYGVRVSKLIDDHYAELDRLENNYV